ncbi:MAG TPA: Holliday junction branch migration protein RuvA [Dehalococcoidia bacterium]
MSPIAQVHGVLAEKREDHVIVMVGGLGLLAYVPGSTLSRLPAVGEEVQLHTYLHVREESLSLYGFLTREEQRLFEMLLGVAGVGPKAALAFLTALSPSELAGAIAAENVEVLTRVPGIGKKLAARLVLELKGKLDAYAGAALPAPAARSDEVLAALVGLGYSSSEAAEALAQVPDASRLSTEERIRLALRYFAERNA